ncbi:FtsX-like permease family protein [Hymenobacter sp. BT491]|uniref:FtsX-like permease family protein n=1 Tax=Hymenobacter sp. BT491 TaxID=2766779 RepID=UPI0016538539|nr:FtsX-like permease family protein [Hymenobacter sp. BT491]MBC6989920.1 ABC transporter permease [Hymenobacter sp. BT491]
MIRHLFTLIWNRKRSNFLLITEIMLSFFVLFVVSSLLVYNLYNYRQPMGFRYDNVWEITLNPGTDTTALKQKVLMVMQQLKASKGVVGVTQTSSNTPFSFSNMNGTRQYNHKQTPVTEFYDADDELRRVLGLNVVEGRWFDRRDNAAARTPAIINKAMQRAVFAEESPIGKIMTDEHNKEQWQIVGVVESYRSGSDFAADEPAMFSRKEITDPSSKMNGGYNVPVLLLRVQPGSGAVLEQKLVKDLDRMTKGWSVTVDPLEKTRISKLKVVLTPLCVLGLVCLFLIVNVALGLFGVLWYNINQRKAEIGLRRALGATSTGISQQFLGEMLVVTTLGVAVGVVVAAQFPLLGVFGVAATVYLQAMGVATVLIFSLTAICAFQPSRIAAGIQPAVSLREE